MLKKRMLLIIAILAVCLVGCSNKEDINLGETIHLGNPTEDYFGREYTMKGQDFLDYCTEVLPNGHAVWYMNDFAYCYYNDYAEIKLWIASTDRAYNSALELHTHSEADEKSGVFYIQNEEENVYEKYSMFDEDATINGYFLNRGNVFIEIRIIEEETVNIVKDYILEKFGSFDEIVNYTEFDWEPFKTDLTDGALQEKAAETKDFVEDYIQSKIGNVVVDNTETKVLEKDVTIEETEFISEETEKFESDLEEKEELSTEYNMTSREFYEYFLNLSDRFRLDESVFGNAYHIDGTFNIGENGICYVTVTPFSPGNYNYETSDYRDETIENATDFGYYKEIEKDTWEEYNWDEDYNAELKQLILIRGNVKITVSGASEDEFLDAYEDIKVAVLEEFSEFGYIVNYEELETLYNEVVQKDELDHIKELVE